MGVQRHVAGHRSGVEIVGGATGRIGAPAGEFVFVAGGRGIGCRGMAVVIHDLRCNRRAVLGVEGHGPGLDPFGVERQVVGYRSVGRVVGLPCLIGGPTGQTVSVKGGCGIRNSQFLTVLDEQCHALQCGRWIVRAFFQVQRHGMVRLADIGPLGVQRQVAGHRSAEAVRPGAGRIGTPSCERIPCTGRIGRSGSLFAVSDELRVNRAAAGRIERDLVRHGPLRVQRHRSGDHAVEVVRLGAVRIGGPAHEFEAILRWRGWFVCRAAQLHGLCSNR